MIFRKYTDVKWERILLVLKIRKGKKLLIKFNISAGRLCPDVDTFIKMLELSNVLHNSIEPVKGQSDCPLIIMISKKNVQKYGIFSVIPPSGIKNKCLTS